MRIHGGTLAALLLWGCTFTSEQLVGDGQEAYVHGDYDTAIEKEKRALAQGVTEQQGMRAWRIIGTSRCFLKDRGGAGEAAAHLDESGKKLLRYVCGRNGILFE
jgi:hypothetical protein